MEIVLASVRLQTPVMYGKGDVNHSGKTDRKEEVNCIEKSQISVSNHQMWALKDSFTLHFKTPYRYSRKCLKTHL